MTADLILTGGTVHTLDAAGTIAQAVAVREGTVSAVGTDAEIEALAGPGTRRIELAGAVVLPGLMDSHLHVTMLGKACAGVLLYDVRSISELVERLAERAASVTGPVVGRAGNLHPAALAEGRLPTARDLDKVAADRPVMITDVNKTIVNSHVLAGINAADVPAGGEALHDAAGRPLGIFMYAAKRMTPLGAQGDTPALDMSEHEAIRKGLEVCRQLGITSVINPSATAAQIAAFRSFQQRFGLPVRVVLMPFRKDPAEWAALDVRCGRTEGRISFGPIKLFFDAFVMHRTALMYEPYIGQPDNRGDTMNSEDELEARVGAALSARWPLGIHATGDRGMDVVADVLEHNMRLLGQPAARCHMIHCYFPTPHALAIAGGCDIAIAAQPTFISAWGHSVRQFVGAERAERFLPLKSMLASGVAVGGGADAPITWPSPWTGIFAAVSRLTEAGGVIGADEAVSVEEAVRMYTLGSAAVAGQEQVRGSIEAGKHADFTVIDRDIMNCDVEQIPATRVLLTVVAGEVVHKAPD